MFLGKVAECGGLKQELLWSELYFLELDQQSDLPNPCCHPAQGSQTGDGTGQMGPHKYSKFLHTKHILEVFCCL